MRIASFLLDGDKTYGVVANEKVQPVSAALRQRWASVADLIGADGYQEVLANDVANTTPIALSAVTLLPPIPNPGKIFCVGLNYKTHIAETGRDTPEYPMLFTRYPQSFVGSEQDMLCPAISDKFDFEGELAVVIGRTAYRVDAADAHKYVAGYSCLNDGSIRDYQRHTTQFTAGKNFYKSGSIGPWMVTSDEIADPENLRLVTRLNGEIMQEATTSDLLFGIGALIAYISSVLPLEPGDIIATGTTGGVGAARKPPVWMKPGDHVEIEISGIGTLSNPIAQG